MFLWNRLILKPILKDYLWLFLDLILDICWNTCLCIFTKINTEVKMFSKQSALKHSLFREQITLITPYLARLAFFLFLFPNEMDSDVVINVIDVVRISYWAGVHTQPRITSILMSTSTNSAGWLC